MKVSPWGLVAVAVVPALFGLSNAMQDVDPAQYADVSRRMLESGNWLDLRDMNGPFVNKPPMMFWAQAICMKVLGVGELAAHLPALLYGVLAVFGTFWAGRVLKDSRLGAIAATFVASSVAFHLMIADPKVDMPLMAFSTLAIAATYQSRTRPRAMWAAWVFAACAMLSKGPIGVVLPMLAVGPELIRREWHPSASLRARIFSVKPLRGVLIVAALVAPFYVALWLHVGPEALHYLLWRQSAGKLNGTSGYLNDTTAFFYLHTSLWAFLPFVPLTITGLVRRAIAFAHARALPGDPTRIVVWWLVLPMMLISASTFKLPQYLYWVTPAAALIAAHETLRLSERVARGLIVTTRVLSAIAIVAAALALTFIFTGSWWWLAAPVAGLVLSVLNERSQAATADLHPAPVEGPARPERVAAELVFAMFGAMVLLHGYAMPAMLTFQPYQLMGESIRRREPTQSVIPVAAMEPSFALAFYSRRDPTYMSPLELLDAVKATGPRLLVLGPDLPPSAFDEVGLTLTPVEKFTSYATSRPRWVFFNQETRQNTLMPVLLVRASLTSSPQ